MYFKLTFQAPCEYYGNCGGCSIQHIENHGEYKFSQLKKSLEVIKTEFILHPIFQVAQKSRRRVSFKVENNRLSLNKARSHHKIAIDHCLLLRNELNELIKPINKLLKRTTSQITAVNMLSSDSGVELLFIAKETSNLADEQLLSNFASQNKIARIAWQTKDQPPYMIIQLSPIQIKFDNVNVNLPINSFLQVSNESSNLMSKIIAKHLEEGKQTLELYCGCGSFTVPIANKTQANIYAIEGSQEAINALNKATNNNSFKIKTSVRDLYQNPLSTSELEDYSQIVINPPRNGAGPQIRQIAKTKKVKRVIMVSCSVENFIRDSLSLIERGFKLTEIYPIDQFLYSKHLELVAVFLRCA